MDRRVSGGLMLVTALLLALVVPKILNPARLDGVATIAPPAPPPVVGDCIDRSISGYSTAGDGQLQDVERVLVVPCSEPHGGEIVRIDGSLPESNTGNSASRFDDLMSNCWTDTLARWYPRTDDWWPQVDISIGVIGPDHRQQASGQRWAACSVGRFNGTLDQTLDTLSVSGTVSPLFGMCSLRSAQEDDAFTTAGCTDPHNHEDLGYRELPAGSTLTQDELTRSCTELAVRATGRAGLPSDPALTVETTVYAWYESGGGGEIALPLPADAAGGGASCSIHTTGDRELTASLRQYGDGPLPFAT